MAREVKAPERIDNSGPTHDYELRHPAFAVIRASRIQGDAVLFGSDFVHRGYVVVEIAPARLTRGLSHDHIYSSAVPYVSVALSESQWATFLSTLNSGSGTPCTLEDRDGVAVPGLPRPEAKVAEFKAEVLEKLEHALAALGRAEALARDPRGHPGGLDGDARP